MTITIKIPSMREMQLKVIYKRDYPKDKDKTYKDRECKVATTTCS